MGTEDFKTKEIPRSALAPRADDNPAHYLGDYDGDGDIDFVQQAPDKSLQLYLNQPNHSYFSLGNTTTIPDLLVGAIYPGDFNGDGKTDLLVLRKYDNESVALSELLWSGNNFIRYDYPITNNASQNRIGNRCRFMIGDFNGDGKDDLWVRAGLGVENHITNYVNLLYNVYPDGLTICDQHNAEFGAQDPSSLPETVTDINGDGKAELMEVNNQEYVFWEYNNGALQVVQRLQRLHANTLLGDVNGDGKTDIGTYNANGDMIWFISTSNSFTQQSLNLFSGYRTNKITKGNTRCDAYDFLFAGPRNCYVDNCVNHILNHFYATDINGDGKTDLLVTGVGTGNETSHPGIYISYNQNGN